MTAVHADESIGTRLAAVAARLPDKPAIVEGDTRVNYRALDDRASAIAHGILAAGHDRPGPVCLLFESKLVAITAIFGAGRAGRAYVPLDAGDPDDRLRFILDDSAPVALVTETKLQARARALAPAGCTIVDVDMPATSGAAAALPAVAADTPLYRFYTSGSTGRPKGVGQTHRNLLFFVDAYVRTLGIVALIVAIFFNVIGLILGIVALVQSRKAGHKNGFAVAAIIVGAVLTVLGIIIAIVAFTAFAAAAGFASEALQACQAVDFTGTVTVQGVSVDCSTIAR